MGRAGFISSISDVVQVNIDTVWRHERIEPERLREMTGRITSNTGFSRINQQRVENYDAQDYPVCLHHRPDDHDCHRLEFGIR